MPRIVIDRLHPTCVATDTLVGANTPLFRFLVPEGKTWSYDPDKHQHLLEIIDTAAGAVVAGTNIFFYKGPNDITSARALIKQFAEGLLPTLANQANSDFAGMMRMTPFTLKAGQELQVFVFIPVGGVAADLALSTIHLELDEQDSRSPQP